MLAMNEIKFKRTEKKSVRKEEPITEMRAVWGRYKLTFWVEGPESKRMRKSACLAIYRAIRPIFKLNSADIFHHDSTVMTQVSMFSRDLSLAQAPKLATQDGRVGAAIRFDRLQRGWTQGDLAAKAKVNRGHISRIESGLYRIRSSTLKRIQEALQAND
jgi:DNA-binding XRE family transcriptional regulator